jgi:hypothetical protein
MAKVQVAGTVENPVFTVFPDDRFEFKIHTVKVIGWESHDGWRYSVYIPVGTEGTPDGKIIAGSDSGGLKKTEALRYALKAIRKNFKHSAP